MRDDVLPRPGRLRPRAASRLDHSQCFHRGQGSLRAEIRRGRARNSPHAPHCSNSRCPRAARARAAGAVARRIEHDASRNSSPAVRKAKSYIRAGDAFQVVVSQRFSAKTNADPFEIYRALRVVNPSPYLYFLKLDDVSVVGSSPEMLVKVQGRDAFYRPLAGTLPRGRNEARRPRARSQAARRSQRARRAHHARRSGPQRSGPRLRIRLGEGRAADVRRALFARDAPRFEPARHAARKDVDCFDALDGLLSRRHAFRRAKSARHGNHRRTRAHPPRHLRRRNSLSRFFRAISIPASACARSWQRMAAPTFRPAPGSWPIPSPSASIRNPSNKARAVIKALEIAHRGANGSRGE